MLKAGNAYKFYIVTTIWKMIQEEVFEIMPNIEMAAGKEEYIS